MRRLSRPLIALLAVVLSLAACGDDDAGSFDNAEYEDAARTTSAPATTQAPATNEAMATESAPLVDDGDAPGPGTDAEGAVTAPDPAALGRLIVYTASISIEVDDVITAGEEAQAAVAGLGGVLFGQETTTGDNPRSVLTIKVPPQNFQAALERLGGVGKLLSQSVFADDVTERVVDIQSQITTSEASVERLRGFLADATDLETVAKLETELLSRETGLEILRGRLRTLQDQVSLATIVLILSEPMPEVPEPSVELIQTGYEGHDDGAGCPGSDEVRVDEDAVYTMCITLINTGDTALGDIEIRDRGLKIDEDDLLLLSGDLENPLPPQGTLIVYYEGVGDPERGTDPAVKLIAVDEAGDQIRTEIGRTVERLLLRVDADNSLPGFVDGLTVAWKGLQRIFGVIVVLSGALVPFLWVPVLAGAAIWYWRKRQSADAERSNHDTF